MISLTLLNLLQSIFYNIVIYCVGKILKNTDELRAFLGVNKSEIEKVKYANVTVWIENTGIVLIILSIYNVLIAVLNTWFIIDKI